MRRGGAGKRRDKVEPSIINALESFGATVAQLSAVDLPDLIVGFQGANYLLEVKSAPETQKRGALRPGQKTWHITWRGQVSTVRSPDEALAAIGVKARRTGND